jgi:hypothetical protein
VTGFNILLQKKTVYSHILDWNTIKQTKRIFEQIKGGTYQKYGLSQILKPNKRDTILELQIVIKQSKTKKDLYQPQQINILNQLGI